MWQSFQPVFEPNHAQPETHRLQTIYMRPLRTQLSEKGGLEKAQGNATHRFEGVATTPFARQHQAQHRTTSWPTATPTSSTFFVSLTQGSPPFATSNIPIFWSHA